ncbi:NAD(P)-dependent oxidoreductase [Yanshouia hominis]|uniref:3-phosphoglycerate dehydrogenase n=1 Tax=Yanshouia hominis TaxID=2763673 RepID=A0ABR7NHJ6_9FIRM|nr:2-hydroxyacid dehydrogenase [Yanshouia hominis]MBC8575322.1 3-phosphoglycerate dehydrogenase [Yanshouia hominis]
MLKIGLTGPYSPNMKAAFYDALPDGFDVVEIPTVEDYGALEDVDFVVLRTLKFDNATINRCKQLKMIQKYAVGYETIDIGAAAARNIPVVNCTGVNTVSVAEMAVLQMLAVLRNLLPLNRRLCAHQWAKDEFVQCSYTLKGKTVGIIGLGSIGRHVAQLLRAFGATVLYYDMFRQSEQTEQELGVTFFPFEELLPRVDLLTLHAPSTPETINLIDREALSKMKRGAILINTARGNLVNEEALIEALQSGQLGGAGLDVFSSEPPAADSPLLHLENVVATPHVGGSTAGNDSNMMRQCAGNIVKFCERKPILKRNIVNLSMLSDPLPIEYQ